ncbi:hypothetical protein [Acuticoccus kandeliae]|uniref:hypothetical protein n=1 Tax=Acuticoccus kandeliae TaxID=2073160 RepID=UPI000D3E7FA4|nr:hypothetical protein [Acuticoccus kandeliae]
MRHALLLSAAFAIMASAGAVQAQDGPSSGKTSAPAAAPAVEVASPAAPEAAATIPVADAPAASPAHLVLDLNALSPHEGGCRVSFVVRNQMATEIEDLSLEVAIFGDSGALDRLLRLNFGLLLDGKTRVRQFDLDGTACDGIGSVLVNDVSACSGADLTPLACLRALETRSELDVTFGL